MCWLAVVESILRGEEIGITPRRRACNNSNQNSREINKSNQNRANKSNISANSTSNNANNSHNNPSNESLPGNDCEIAGKIKIKHSDENNIGSVMQTSDTSKSSITDLSDQRHQASEVSV